MENKQGLIPLKSCPFCGSVNLEAIHNTHYDDFVVICRNCGVEGPVAPRLLWAQQGWNMREEEYHREQQKSV